LPELSPIEQAYEIAKLHAATDGHFAEPLTRQWFNAAWEICADAVGIQPPRQVTENVSVLPNGTVQLSGRPTSDVRLYANGMLVAVLPPNAPELSGHKNLPNPYAHGEEQSLACSVSLCCYCNLCAVYDVGSRAAMCDISPAFLQAVCQLFAYIAENRGDTKLDDQILTRSGAKGFLAPSMTYVL
jgi:hypothetical protein